MRQKHKAPPPGPYNARMLTGDHDLLSPGHFHWPHVPLPLPFPLVNIKYGVG